MRIKLDENMPADTKALLQAFGHDVHTVFDESLERSGDDAIFEAVLRERRFLITQDLDFSDTRKFVPGQHPGIMILRLGDANRFEVIRRLREVFSRDDAKDWAGWHVTVKPDSVRVNSPA
jgi:predicted nuclease of predicted toxin-antitoxin system